MDLRACLLALVGASAGLWAGTAPASAQAGLETAATHAVIMDYETGQVLFSKNADEPTAPASMTKLMTALIAFELIKDGSMALTDLVTVPTDAWRRGGFASGSSTMCLEPGEKVSVLDLLRGIIVLSGNDASIALATHIAGSEPGFAQMMNRRAAQLGFNEGTNFVNATGWPDEGHVVSARDLATIGRLLIQDHPELYRLYAEREFGFCTEAPQNRYNRNPLLTAGADGLKTGHTSVSGYGVVGSKQEGKQRRIIVVNGLESEAARAREARKVMNAAFREFRVAEVFRADQRVASAPVYMGDATSVALVIQDGVTIGYPRRATTGVSAHVDLPRPLKAPVAAGEPVGTLVVTTPGGETIERTVYTRSAVGRLGARDRALAALVHLIRARGKNDEAAANVDG